METEIIRIDPDNINPNDLKKAVNLIKKGEVVAFPTETVYGLGASIYCKSAIQEIFNLKGRPMDNPLIVHISDMNMLDDLVLDISESSKSICKKFWPGPLTILFNKSEKVSNYITAGLSTVAIRMPSNKIAISLINQSKVPIAAPSANLSSKPSPTSAQHVYDDFKSKIALIIDGGNCHFGVESTVIDLQSLPPKILRPGGITLEKLKEYIPTIEVYKNMKSDESNETPSTPGLKYKHYSPKAPIYLIDSSIEETANIMQRIYNENTTEKKKIGILHFHKSIKIPDIIINNSNCKILSIGLENTNEDFNPVEIAQKLFFALRLMDKCNVELIIAESISEKYEGLAVMNRLRKAAQKIIK